jgi:RNA polymerase-associated protein RTF1
MITVSDHRPTPDDVAKYVSQLKTDRQSDNILSKKKAIKLRKKQDNLVNNYTYTKEDIERLVTEKKKRKGKASSNIGLEKTRIAIAVQAARDAVKEAEQRLEDAKIEQMEADDSMSGIAESNVTKAREALEDANALLQDRIEEQERILKDEEERTNRLKGSSKVQNWVKVNQRARLANQTADFQSYKEQLAKEKAETSAEPKFDPFARRKVKPKNLWEVGGKQSSDKSSDAVNGTMEEEKKDSHPSDRDNAAARADADHKREDTTETPKENPASYVFDEDINIGDIANLGLGMKKVTNRARKGISLEDYQSRKAAGTL